MKKLIVSKQQARRFLLEYQGLGPSSELMGKSGILSYIHRVGCIQFDPLNIIGQNQELVLQSRIAGFRSEMLQELLYQERRLIDGWDKNMSIYSTEDWPYFHRNREAANSDIRNNSGPIAAIRPKVRTIIEERGPLSSTDLEYNQTVDWPWAPTRLSRAALESMYFQGELVIHHKIRARKVYDLAVRHLPAELLAAPDPNPIRENYHDWYVLRRIGSIGLLWNKSGDAWPGISGIKAKERGESINRLLKRKRIIELWVDGIKVPLYMRSSDKPCLDKILHSTAGSTRTAIIAPLDNLLWDRRLVKELFDFEYRWEVYKPANERSYGYYVLPVLYGDRFIARFEPGRDKKNGALAIKNWWWEPGVNLPDGVYPELTNCFRKFAAYLGMERIQLEGELVKKKDLDWLAL